MLRRARTRRAILALGGGALALGSLGGGIAARSEFLAGQGFPYDAFDRLPQTQVPALHGRIRVGIAPGALAVSQPVILDWVRRSATAVSTYYGRFPVDAARLLIFPVAGADVPGATTWGYRGAAIRILLGRDADEAALQRDWKMVHEMVHLALPDLDERHAWLSEGLAVYVEPIARVQAGELQARTIWADMVRDMPQGLPGPADGGLDGTRSWARTYWGGAIFCLCADIGIRRRTENRLGLQDAMRAVLAAGGNHEVAWPIRRILAVAARAVGARVLSELYATMGARPIALDLLALWRELGVRAAAGGVTFDEAAPLASIRAALTAGRSA